MVPVLLLKPHPSDHVLDQKVTHLLLPLRDERVPVLGFLNSSKWNVGMT